MPVRNPDDLKVIGVFFGLMLVCLAPAEKVSATPFPTQDQNPFALIHGQPQPTGAQLPDKNIFIWSLDLDITNTLNTQSNSQEALLIDYESYLLRFGFIYGLTENWALRIDIPFIAYDGGFLDGMIDNWHQLFNLPEGNRPLTAKNRLRIFYRRNGVPVINLTSPTSGPGDIQIGIGKKLHDNQQTILSLWSSIDISTGSQSDFTSNDASDISLWLAAEHELSPRWKTDANLGALFPGENKLGILAVEDNIWFGYAALQWQQSPTLDFRIQLGGHTQYYANSQLVPLGPAYNIVLGGVVHMSTCSDLSIAVSEDIKVGATPDVSFLFSWKHKTGNCE